MILNRKIISVIIWLTVFSIAMAFFESSVVVYLRKLYYPAGFEFPMVSMDSGLLFTEIFREAATIIMLIGAGILAGRNFAEKFGYFLYCFAVWDIFYYVFLKLLLNWPDSLLTWDILFLIPVAWVGPVVTPVILSIIMILFAGLIVYFCERSDRLRIKFVEWIILIFGSLVVIFSFTLDYMNYFLQHFSVKDIFSELSREGIIELSLQYVPEKFNWLIYFIGVVIILTGIGVFYKRNIKVRKPVRKPA